MPNNYYQRGEQMSVEPVHFRKFEKSLDHPPRESHTVFVTVTPSYVTCLVCLEHMREEGYSTPTISRSA